MDRVNIIITGRRNTGKSSLINSILGQEKSIVSEIPGTTTDPVRKSYEIPGVAPVILIDTAGVDDIGELGNLRIDKTFEAIKQADIALLVITGNNFSSYEEQLIQTFNSYKQPFLIIHNKTDLFPISSELKQELETKYKTKVIDFSSQKDSQEIIKALSKLIRQSDNKSLLGNIISPRQVVMLVTPIDSEAPAGRMILPQVQLLRDTLDNHCISIVLQPEEVTTFFTTNSISPDLVITDSQVFGEVAKMIPEEIPLTSFSIVLAHHKGNFAEYLKGTPHIDLLKNKDRILILESCSHHISCEDIGRFKIPALIRKHTNKELEFEFISGLDKIQRPITDYALIIQCGACMITSTQLANRLQTALDNNVPVTNYGMTIAWIKGIFKRAVQPFIGAD